MGLVDDQQLQGQEQMPFAKLSVNEAEDRIVRYLSQRRGTLWSRAFDLSNSGSRKEASEFLLTAMQDLNVVVKPNP